MIKDEYRHLYRFELFDIGHVSKNPMTGRTDWVDVIYRNTNV